MITQIKPANKEQWDALSKSMLYMEKGDAQQWMVIVGKAGTGKTTLASLMLKGYTSKHTILVCALSHKAKLVITQKLLEAGISKDKIISKSVAGALGMNMDTETGKFSFVANDVNEPAIKTATIIIVDEASMINEESHELIMSLKKRKAKVIYLGDIRQLPPIREQDSPYQDKASPVFYGKNVAVLSERIRQGEFSPILPFADYFGDNSRTGKPVLNPAPLHSRKSIVCEQGALVFVENTIATIKAVFPLFQNAIESGNGDIVKFVTYRNETRKTVNQYVRSLLFGDECDEQFVVGDLLMFMDNYNINGMEEPISNSVEVQVTDAFQYTDRYKVWSICFVFEGKTISVTVLDKTEVPRHAADVSKLFEIAKKMPFGTDDRSQALLEAWQLKKKYAPVDYAYAITSHKAQGSTYNTVIVDEKDIMSVKMISNKEKSQSMYTAITRASTTCIVIDGQRAEDDSLYDAVLLSQQINHNKNYHL